jgi:hypothetical protein
MIFKVHAILGIRVPAPGGTAGTERTKRITGVDRRDESRVLESLTR